MSLPATILVHAHDTAKYLACTHTPILAYTHKPHTTNIQTHKHLKYFPPLSLHAVLHVGCEFSVVVVDYHRLLHYTLHCMYVLFSTFSTFNHKPQKSIQIRKIRPQPWLWQSASTKYNANFPQVPKNCKIPIQPRPHPSTQAKI